MTTLSPTRAGSSGQEDKNRLTGVFYGMGAGALWGLVFLAPKLAGEFSPIQLSIGRYLCYGLMAAVLLAPRWRAVLSQVSRRQWLSLFWLALVGNTLYYMLLSNAVQAGGIAMTSLVIGFLPVTVTIIGSRDHGAVPLKRLLPSLLLCAAGAICIGWQALTGPAVAPPGQRLVGLLCAVGGLASWTTFAVYNTRCLTRLRHISAQDWNLLTGIVTGLQCMALIPLALAFSSAPHAMDAWLRFGAASVGVAVLCSIIANALWNKMSRLLPLTLVGQMILFETLFALVYGFIWEQRWPALLEIATLVLLVMSVMTCLAAHRRTEPRFD